MNTFFRSATTPWSRCLAFAAVMGLAAPAVTFAAKEPSATTGERKSYAYSWQQELEMGAAADKEITEKMGLYEHPEIQAYVDSVGRRVLAASTFADQKTPEMYRNTKFTFRVIDSPVVNAFALPGGYVYVTRGLMTHVQNEAQLAVVLGHEIAHVAARHASQQARRSQWTQLGVIGAAILGQKVLGDRAPDLGNLVNLGGTAAQAFMLRYSREAEHESDNLGVTYAARAGYNAAESVRFFEVLKRVSATEGKSLPTWQSSHPDPGDRAKRVQQITAAAQAAPAAPGAPAPASMVGEDEYLKRIEGIVVGEDPREGFAQNGVFYHPTLRFQFQPANGWKMDNQKAAVVFAEPNGRALMGLQMASGARARDAAAAFAQKNKINVTGSTDTQINGLPASVILGQAQSEQGELGVWNAFIEHEGRVYSILGYAPAAAFESVRRTFEGVAASFSPLRDPNIAQVQPARLKLVRADRNAPFASFVPTSLPPNLNAENLAVMNQLRADEPVPAGRVLKIPDVAQSAPTSTPGGAYPQGIPPGTTYPGQTTYPAPDRNPYPPPGTYPPAYPSDGRTAPPPGTSYPPQSYPGQTYPPASSQPAPQPPAYPSSTPPSPYPGQPYPGTTQPGASYPPQQPNTSYPGSPTGAPQPTYDPSRYPSPGQTPPNSSYPNSGYPPSHPPSAPQSYPANPAGSPQFPQPGQTQNRPAAPAGNPSWPR